MKIVSKTEKSTRDLGELIARQLKVGDIICLIGDLGAGKTTFVKGMAAGLDLDPMEVSSPTFVLMNVYEGRLPLFHFDLYRLNEISEMNQLGLDEYLFGDGVAVLEWAERLGSLMPEEYLKITLDHCDEGRSIALEAHGQRYKDLVHQLDSEMNS